MIIKISDLPNGGFQVKIDSNDVATIFKVTSIARAFELIPNYVDVLAFKIDEKDLVSNGNS